MDIRNCALKVVPAEHMKALRNHLISYEFREDPDLPGDEAINFAGEGQVVQTMQDVARTLVGNTNVQVLDGDSPASLFPSAIKMKTSTTTHEHSDYDTSKCKTQSAIFTMYIVMKADHPIDFNIDFGTKGRKAYELRSGEALYFPAHRFHEVVQPAGKTRTAFVYHYTTPKLSRYTPRPNNDRKLRKLRPLRRRKYCC